MEQFILKEANITLKNQLTNKEREMTQMRNKLEQNKSSLLHMLNEIKTDIVNVMKSVNS